MRGLFQRDCIALPQPKAGTGSLFRNAADGIEAEAIGNFVYQGKIYVESV